MKAMSAQRFAEVTALPLPQVFRLIRQGRLAAWRHPVTRVWWVELPVKLSGQAANGGHGGQAANVGRSWHGLGRR